MSAGNGSGRTPKPSDEFVSWPPSAQEAYLGMKGAARRFRQERDAARAKGGGYGTPVDTSTPVVAGIHELTLPWLQWMDGRIHRLKQGKHFDGEVSAVIEEARLAARVSGRGIVQMREQFGTRYQYVWVQFADHAIFVGDPCPCGGRKLSRLHPNLARCRRCGATMTLSPR